MGLLDKVKEKASQGLEKATQAGVAGQAKLDAMTAKRKVDTLLREIGAAVYREQTTGEQADIAALVEQVRQVEAEHGNLASAPSAGEEGYGTEEEASEPSSDG